MARVPISAAGRELYALYGRTFDSLSEPEWRALQDRWRPIFEAEAPLSTAESYPLEHLNADPSHRFKGVQSWT